MAYELTIDISGKTLSVFGDGIYEGGGAAPVQVDIDADGAVKHITASEIVLADYATKSDIAAAVAPVRVVRWVGNGLPSRSFTLPCEPGFIRFFLAGGAERVYIAGVGVWLLDASGKTWAADPLDYGSVIVNGCTLSLAAGSGGFGYNVSGRVVVAFIYPLSVVEVLS